MRLLPALACLLLSAASNGSERANELYQQGHSAAMSGELDEGGRLLDQALALDPQHFLAAFDRAQVYEAQGENGEALRFLEKACELRPDFAEAQVQAAALLLSDPHKLALAAAHLRRAVVERYPYIDDRFTLAHTRLQAFRDLALVYAEGEQTAAAQSVARGALADDTLDHSDDEPLRLAIKRAGDAAAKLSPKDAAQQEPEHQENALLEALSAAAGEASLDKAFQLLDDILWLDLIHRRDPQSHPRPSMRERLTADPRLRLLHADRRFAALLDRYGLSQP